MAGYMEEMTEKVKMRNEDTFGGSFPVRVYKVSTGWCQETHSHEYMQIWYVVSGSCTHIVEGAEYPLRAKNIFVIPPFVEHGLKDERDNFTIICCEFPAELITGDNLFDPAGRGLLRYTCIESFAAVLSRTRPCHTPGELSRVMLEQLLDEMLAEYDRRAEYYEIILKADVLKLLTLLARDYSEAMADGGAIVRSYSAYIDKAVAFIEENFRDKLHIEDAAKAASMSVSYFSYFFRERTGRSFREYVSQRRIEAAKVILLQGGTAAEAAAGAGFPDTAYFNRVFKKTQGVTPSAFRRINGTKPETILKE
ncbi:MAG TPA: AraC family transcriptional regulator [Firmicutes bacterium]|nr:AraC family transcriptional regulator [Bacillota bacterium]